MAWVEFSGFSEFSLSGKTCLALTSNLLALMKALSAIEATTLGLIVALEKDKPTLTFPPILAPFASLLALG